MKKLLFVTFIIPLLFVGCDQSKFKASKVGENGSETDVSSPAIEVEKFAVGDEIQISDEIVTIHGIQDHYAEFEWLGPKEGHVYKTIEVSVKNVGTSEVDYTPFDFKLKDDQGFSYDISIIGNKSPNLEGGTLSPGDNARGFITYHVLPDAQNLRVIFKPKWWSHSQAEVEL